MSNYVKYAKNKLSGVASELRGLILELKLFGLMNGEVLCSKLLERAQFIKIRFLFSEFVQKKTKFILFKKIVGEKLEKSFVTAKKYSKKLRV